MDDLARDRVEGNQSVGAVRGLDCQVHGVVRPKGISTYPSALRHREGAADETGRRARAWDHFGRRGRHGDPDVVEALDPGVALSEAGLAGDAHVEDALVMQTLVGDRGAGRIPGRDLVGR